MEYNSKSFFEKYSIKPNLSKEKIKVLFQTDPVKRKDLPIVLKVISNDESMYKEELFTPHEEKELKEHSLLITLYQNLKAENYVGSFKEITKHLLTILTDKEYNTYFFYNKSLSKEKANKIFDDFIICLIHKLEREFISSIGHVSDSNLKIMYNSICNIYENSELDDKYLKEFKEDICDFLNNVLTLDSLGKEFTNKFNSLLILKTVIDYEYYDNTLKFTLDKMNKDIKKYGEVLVECYENISKSFKGEELKNSSYFLQVMIYQKINLSVEKSNIENNKNFKTLKRLQTCCLAYNKKRNKTIKDEEFLLHEELLDYIVFAGSEWKKDYNKKFKEMISNTTENTIYEFIKVVVEGHPTKGVLKVISNIIIQLTGFDNIFNYIINTHEASFNGTSDKYIDPKIVDQFIAKYYWLVYTYDSKEINKTFFNNIKNIGFDILAVNQEKMDLLKSSSLGAYQRENLRKAIIRTYSILPGNWKMDDGRTVRQTVTSLGEYFSGSDGVSEVFVTKYKALFAELKEEMNSLYNCPKCNALIDEDDIDCPKCNFKLDWDKINKSSNYEHKDDDDDYDDDSDSSSSSPSERFFWLVIIILIITLMAVASAVGS
ncbi:MAG: zinc ribbon domain-containing protein [Bacilli bacterium]|nr:zinc ribbon domain-containing protein [Bacilli bacterium]